MPSKSHHHLHIHNRGKASRLLERLMLGVAIIEPMTAIPQIMELYNHPETKGVSGLSWLLALAASTTWLVYGLKVRNRPLIVAASLWVVMEIAVLAGVYA